MIEEIDELMNFLNIERRKLAPYYYDETKRYYRVIHQDRAAHCFIVKEDFENKTLGKMKAGDLMMPATYNQPAKHARGSIFDKETWESAFGEWGMKLLSG